MSMSQFMADEKSAKQREVMMEEAAEFEAARYFDDCETGDNTEWATYDVDASADAVLAIWRVLNQPECSTERVALAKEICTGLMYMAANHHANQVTSRRD